jgi:hypothetical protein
LPFDISFDYEYRFTPIKRSVISHLLAILVKIIFVLSSVPSGRAGGQIDLQPTIRNHHQQLQPQAFCRTAEWLYNPKEMQDNKYYGDNNQNVNPIAGLGKTGTDPPAEKAQQPQDEQNYYDGPQHEISPFERPIKG